IEELTDTYANSAGNFLVEENKFLNVFLNSPVATIIVDMTTNEVYAVNQAFASLSGRESDTVIGKSVPECNFWVDNSEREELLKRLLQNSFVTNFQASLYSAEEEVIPVRISSSYISLNGRKCAVHYVIKIIDDLNQPNFAFPQEAAELSGPSVADSSQNLPTRNSIPSNTDFHSMFERIPVGIYRTTFKGQFLLANPTLAKILGYDSVDEIMQINSSMLYDSPQTRYNIFFNKQLVGTVFHEETRLRRKDGSFIWVNDYAIIYRDPVHEYILDGALQDITVQKELQVAMCESENKYRFLFENLNDVFVLFNSNGLIQNVSPSFENICGINPQSFIQQNVAILLDNDPINTYFLQNYKKIKEQTTFNIVFRRKSKERRYHSINLQPVFSPISGVLTSLVGIARDITSEIMHNKVTNTLYDISRAVNSSDDLIELYKYIHKALGNIIDTTNFYIAIVDQKNKLVTFPYIVDEMDGPDASEPLPLDTPNSNTLKVITGKKPILRCTENTEDLPRDKVIGTISKAWLGVPLQIRDEVIGAIVVQSYSDANLFDEKDINLLRSVSDQIALAIARKQSQMEIFHNMQFLYNLIDSIPHGIYYKNASDGKYTLCNNAFANTIGFARTKIIDKTNHDLYLHEKALEYDQRDIELLANPHKTQHYNMTKIDYNGNTIYSEFVRSCTFDLDGTPDGIIGVILDTTEQEKAKANIYEALQKQIELNDLKNKFISMVSHEYRTPLQAISLAAELLQNYYNNLTVENREKQFIKIKDSIIVLNSMLDDVLLLNRKDRGMLRFCPDKVDITSCIKRQVHEMQFVAKNHVTLDLKITSSAEVVIADEKMLHLVLQNLINNAIKYSFENGVVQLVFYITQEKLVADIIDHGIGIPKQDQEMLFSPFFRASNVRTISGTGLGLSLVKEAVALQGGKITFDSEEDKGTTFHLEIPFQQE
ncbi:MAG: PAS domain S-box protein, partial [Candidatus Kapabacteria bacterium]|nr:PAS domain S-box protein [Candidatus Kapabacteria bacterium]